jgi:nitroreductase
MDLLHVIRERHSFRVAFDPEKKVPEAHLGQILDATASAKTRLS